MQTTAIKVMGVKVNATLPTNLEEILALPGASPEKVFKAALKHLLYHGLYTTYRDKIVEFFATVHNLKPKLTLKGKEVVAVTAEVEGKQVTTYTFLESGKPVPEDKLDSLDEETQETFFKRVCAEQGVEPTAYTADIQKIVDEVPVTMNIRERVAREAKANRQFIKLATEIFDAGVQDRVAAQIAEFLGEPVDITDESREVNINNLALAIQSKEKQEAEARRKQLLGAI